MSNSTAVFLGRNVAGTCEPMSDYAWADFRSGVWALLDTLPAPIVYEGPGAGFDTTTGEAEQAYVFVIACEVPEYLAQQVANLAGEFDQAEVAILAGQTTFWKPGLDD